MSRYSPNHCSLRGTRRLQRRRPMGPAELEPLETRMFLDADSFDVPPSPEVPVVSTPGVYQFIFTSDAHYGITRTFRGQSGVSAQQVNEAMLDTMKVLPLAGLPTGQQVGPIDFIAMTGDIANRMEKGVQTAAASWAQFAYDYLGLDPTGNPVSNPACGLQSAGSLVSNAPVYLLPGNHDVSNALGHIKILPLGAKDPTVMVQVSNRMLGTSLTNATFDYAVDKVNYSKDLGGVHMMFVNMWPDSNTLAWMASDLATVSSTTPVLLFTHDQPEVDIKHFTDPNGGPPNANYENLLVDTPADQSGVLAQEQVFIDFLQAHPNLVGYFHGNDNYNQFYTWKGPDSTWEGLSTFRVDSPMKGKDSAVDESKLSYQLVTLDTNTNTLTARECLWNLPAGQSPWGASTSMRLFPNQAPSFALAGNPPASDEDAGLQTVAGFATNIAAGPAFESEQTLSFHLTVSGDLAFISPPTLDPVSGTLSYQAAPNAHGTATVTVMLQDDGGRACGGVDTSLAQTLTITVNAVNDPPTALPQSVAVAEDGVVPIALAGADRETPMGQMAFTIASLPTQGVLRAGGEDVKIGRTFVGSPENLTYEPGAGAEATSDWFAFTVTDTSDPALSTEAADPRRLTSDLAPVQICIQPYRGIQVAGGILRLGGTEADDVITSHGGKLVFNRTPVSLEGIAEIRIWGRGGNDQIDLSGLSIRSAVFAGAGDDVVTGSSAEDLLLGAQGEDLLTGEAGDDLLIGGQGRDRLVGSAGDDLLAGGDSAGRLTVQDLWNALEGWVHRTTAAPNAGWAQRVFTDDHDDVLSGSSGEDWFIVSSGDKLSGLGKSSFNDGEVITFVA